MTDVVVRILRVRVRWLGTMALWPERPKPPASTGLAPNEFIQRLIDEMKKLLIGAHRGAMCYAPENTLPAFEIAIEQGTYRIECDIRRTADGALVLMHDDTVDRTTGGTGNVSDMNLKQVHELRCKDDVKVPTFREALQCVNGRARLLVELKDAGIAKQAIAEIIEESMQEACTLISFNEDNTRTARKEAPHIARGIFHIKPGEISLDALIEDFDPKLLIVWPDAATPELIADAKARGLHVRCGFHDRFTYEESFEVFRRVVDMGVDEISCGRPDWIGKMIAEIQS